MDSYETPMDLLIYSAVVRNDIDGIKNLLGTSSRDEDLNQTTDDGETPLFLAAKMNRRQILNILIELGKRQLEVGKYNFKLKAHFCNLFF